MQKIYLAGPEVFLKDAEDVFARKKAICAQYGFDGMSPLDTALDLQAYSKHEAARIIYENNEALMQDCDLIVANITPFRGVSADAGTVYEIGLMRGLGKPLFAYSNHPSNYVSRVQASPFYDKTTGRDTEDNEIEDFDLVDNLMISGGVDLSGGAVIIAKKETTDPLRDLTTFEQTVSTAKNSLGNASSKKRLKQD